MTPDSAHDLFTELHQLTALSAPSGAEHAVADWIADRRDGAQRDLMGNVRLVRERPRVLVTAHMDQVGYMVSRVEADVATCLPVGSPKVAEGRTIPVQALTAGGIVDAELESLGSDGGRLRSDRLAEVSVGDRVVFAPGLEELDGGRVRGRSLDDRIGCLVALRAADALAAEAPEVAFAWTAREESEQSGVIGVARDLEPDALIAVDITYATTPDQELESPLTVGAGPAITLLDGGMVAHGPLLAAFEQAAAESAIEWQREVVSGGVSEAGRAHRLLGLPALALLVPIDAPHSPDEAADLRDVAQCVDLLVGGIRQVLAALEPREPVGA